MPSPSTALRTASVQAVGVVALEGRHARAHSCACDVSRLPTATRGPAGSDRRGREPGQIAVARPERRRREVDGLGVRQVAGDGHDRVRRPVCGRQKSRIVLAGSARMPSSSPQISRPSGPSPNIACWKRIWQYSDGSSRYERISSTMTVRSWSISAVVERRAGRPAHPGRPSPAPPRAAGRGPSRRSTRDRSPR